MRIKHSKWYPHGSGTLPISFSGKAERVGVVVCTLACHLLCTVVMHNAGIMTKPACLHAVLGEALRNWITTWTGLIKLLILCHAYTHTYIQTYTKYNIIIMCMTLYPPTHPII